MRAGQQSRPHEAWSARFQSLRAPLLIARGKRAEGEMLFQKASQVLLKTCGPQHDWTQQALSGLKKAHENGSLGQQPAQ
jgi:hypothetical protein